MRKLNMTLTALIVATLVGMPAFADAQGSAKKAEQPAAAAPATLVASVPVSAAATPVAKAAVAPASARQASGDSIMATVTFLKGMARVQSKGATKFTNLALGNKLGEGDTAVTLENARMELKLDTGQVVRLGSATKFTLQAMKKTSGGGVKGVLKVVSGRIWFTLGKLTGDSDLKTETPTVVAAVKGTVYRTDVASDGTTDLAVYDGVVSASAPGQAAVDVMPNEKLAAMPNSAFEKGAVDEASDDKDDFIRWNKSRDKLRIMIIIPETHGTEKATASVSENTAMTRFMNNYLFKVIEKEQVDKIRESEKLKAALKGDNAAAAAAGLEVGSDIIIVGSATAKYFTSPALGGLISATANMTLRAVRADTAEVIAALTPPPTRAVDITDEAAAYKALGAATEKASSAFIDSIMAKWRRDQRKGTGLDVTVDGVNFKTLKVIRNTLSTIEGVSDVQQLYLVGKRALLSVTYKGDTATLAEEIEKATFTGLNVGVVGLSAYKLEVEVTPPKKGEGAAEAAPAAAVEEPAAQGTETMGEAESGAKPAEAPKPKAVEAAPAAAPATEAGKPAETPAAETAKPAEPVKPAEVAPAAEPAKQ
jgi:hypothetical protein